MGGLAVGAAFVIDIDVGLVTWLVAAAHEIPQELGDFGVLVHSGWRRRSALAWNFVSALTFLVGACGAEALSNRVSVTHLLPFAAGNFVYIAAADLIPEITTGDDTDAVSMRDRVETSAAFFGGLAILLGVALAT